MKKGKISKIIGLIPLVLLAIGLFVYLISQLVKHPVLCIIIIVVACVLMVGSILLLKGTFGRATLMRKIGYSKSGEFYVVNNLMVVTGDKRSTEIDHIVINKYGVWIISEKNYKGKVYGSDYQKEWVLISGISKVRTKIPSPVIENKLKIEMLKEKIGNAPIQSVVVFIRGDISYIDSKDVIKPKDINEVINKGNEVLSEKQIQEYYDKLIDIGDDRVVSYYENIKEVKKVQEEENKNICPRCGRQLVVSMDEEGQPIYICSGYPDCRYIK